MTDWLTGPDPSDPPEEDDLLATVNAAIGALAGKLREEPALGREEARLFIKMTAPECAMFFRPVIWPEARKLAGLSPLAKAGRPRNDQRPIRARA